MTDDPSPQELVLTLLGGHLHPRTRPVWSGGLVTLLGELGFSQGAARIALTRLVNRGLLVPGRDGRFVHYTPTSRMVALLEDGDRRIFSLGREPRPAGDWTVLWQNVPEHRRRDRERLVRRLRFLGFGQLQGGTWLAPHDREADVLALLAELDVTGYAGLMRGRPSAALDVRAFAARAWDLDALARRYADFVAAFGEPREVPDDTDAFLLRTRLVHTFRAFPSLDPELPEELVAPPSGRAEAVRVFHDLYRRLAPAAQRHFETHADRTR